MKVGVTQSPGGGGVRQGVLRKEQPGRLKEQQEDQPACLMRVSRGTGGSWSLSCGQGLEVGWKPWTVQSRGGMWSDVRVKRVL